MKLAHIRVRSFRNIDEASVEPGPDVCVLYGANAQGKTNFLEALYTLSNLRSFRTHRLRDLLPLGGKFARVEAIVESVLGDTRLSLQLISGGRQPLVNGKAPTSAPGYLAELPTVVFSPQDLVLARGSQELRRRYLDRATFLAEPTHLAALRNYNRSLKHRNVCLRSVRDELKVWNQQVARHGGEVHQARRRTLKDLVPLVDAIHGEISGGEAALSINCSPSYGEHVEEELLVRLTEAEKRDQRLGHTSVGPHRDAIKIRLGGLNLDEHASQGQTRTVALSLKLALLKWAQKVRGIDPVFLLDDPGSELDKSRLGYLGDFLSRWPGQVIITGTERDGVPLPKSSNPRYYRVKQGIFHAE